MMICIRCENLHVFEGQVCETCKEPHCYLNDERTFCDDCFDASMNIQYKEWLDQKEAN